MGATKKKNSKTKGKKSRSVSGPVVDKSAVQASNTTPIGVAPIGPDGQPALGNDAQMARCLQCGKTVMTQIRYVPGLLTWMLSIPCCCIPFCIDSCKVRNMFTTFMN